MSAKTLPRLDRQLLASLPAHKGTEQGKPRPDTILQFGEGGFLRGFVDWMIHRLHTKGLYQGGIVVVQPIAQGMVNVLNEQNGVYTQLLRGVQNGQVVEEREIITSINRGIDPYADYDAFLACAWNPDLRFVVSNTTEAGIALSADDKIDARPPVSFPAKLTRFLLERYNTFRGDPKRGLVMLPCELIEFNGTNLKRCVLEIAHKWTLPADFIAWVTDHNHFCNTLVDRIVTGYPREEAAALSKELGYDDRLLNTGEIFHAWVIEGPASLADELPFRKAGLDVTFTPDYKPYRDRKVRILNGAHTMTVLGAYLAGKNLVKECMDDPVISSYLAKGLHDEIIPTLDLPKSDLEAFASAVSERFSNPYVKHLLLSISLNSTSKFKARVLPSLKTYVARKGTLPRRLTFSLAALIAFYQGTELTDGALIGKRKGEVYKIQDDAAVLKFFFEQWNARGNTTAAITRAVLANLALWGEDLNAIPGLTDAVTGDLRAILANGTGSVLATIEGAAKK